MEHLVGAQRHAALRHRGQDRGTVGDYIDTLPSLPDYDHMKAYEQLVRGLIPRNMVVREGLEPSTSAL
jgi:hypothetical protein